MRKDGWKIDDIAARLKTSHAGVYRMMERGRIVINETVEASK
jgi:transcriptional regulator